MPARPEVHQRLCRQGRHPRSGAGGSGWQGAGRRRGGRGCCRGLRGRAGGSWRKGWDGGGNQRGCREKRGGWHRCAGGRVCGRHDDGEDRGCRIALAVANRYGVTAGGSRGGNCEGDSRARPTGGRSAPCSETRKARIVTAAKADRANQRIVEVDSAGAAIGVASREVRRRNRYNCSRVAAGGGDGHRGRRTPMRDWTRLSVCHTRCSFVVSNHARTYEKERKQSEDHTLPPRHRNLLHVHPPIPPLTSRIQTGTSTLAGWTVIYQRKGKLWTEASATEVVVHGGGGRASRVGERRGRCRCVEWRRCAGDHRPSVRLSTTIWPPSAWRTVSIRTKFEVGAGSVRNAPVRISRVHVSSLEVGEAARRSGSRLETRQPSRSGLALGWA